MTRGTSVAAGVDPARDGTSIVGTANRTLRRNASITRGDSNGNDLFDPMVEWSGVPNGRLDDLGRHGMSEAP